MIRTIPLLVSAILLSRPSMPPGEAARYAATLNEVAREHDFDPLTAVAIIHFETRWQPSLVSPDGEDYGLGQVRARYLAGCRGDEDPVNAPSEACVAAKASLLDGAANIRRMASIITANRELCRERTGTAWAPQWLAGYQGYNSPSRERWCKPGAKTWRVLEYRKALMNALLPKPKAPPPIAKAPAAKPAQPRVAAKMPKGSTRR